MKDTKYITISASEAESRGDFPITHGYKEDEYDILDRAIKTLGEKKHVLVRTREGIVIARPVAEVAR